MYDTCDTDFVLIVSGLAFTCPVDVTNFTLFYDLQALESEGAGTAPFVCGL